MGLRDHPGYLGVTSAGVVALHADWPLYPAEHGWPVALETLCLFPAGTTFRPIDDIDRCVLFVAETFEVGKDPFSAANFHAAIWHKDLLELVRRGYARGAVGVTERVHELNKRLDMESRPPVGSWPETGPPELAQFDMILPDGETMPVELPPWDSYDEDDEDWVAFPVGERLAVTSAGWRTLEDEVSQLIAVPPDVEQRLHPLLEAELYDTAIREMSVHLETRMRTSLGATSAFGWRLVALYVRELERRRAMPSARIKVLNGDLRTAFKFVRNEFAHNVRDLPRARGLALLQRMATLYEAVVALEAASEPQ